MADNFAQWWSEEWAGFGWYRSLSHALLKVFDLKVRIGEARSLKELAADIVTAKEEIMAAWEPQVEVKVEVKQTTKRKR